MFLTFATILLVILILLQACFLFTKNRKAVLVIGIFIVFVCMLIVYFCKDMRIGVITLMMMPFQGIMLAIGTTLKK